MNTKNNRRHRMSIDLIENAFMELLQTKELQKITVSELCQLADVNRSTFYANYLDVYDLADKLREKLYKAFEEEFPGLSNETRQYGSLRVFRHIKENQMLYKTFFKLGYDELVDTSVYDIEQATKDFDNKHIKYHVEFFRHGFNAIVKMWLNGGCVESPEEMAEIVKREYAGRGY